MKVYIATSFVQKELAQKWRDALLASGIEISHDWTVVENPFSDIFTAPSMRTSFGYLLRRLADADAGSRWVLQSWQTIE
jgi:hypothetical protein